MQNPAGMTSFSELMADMHADERLEEGGRWFEITEAALAYHTPLGVLPFQWCNITDFSTTHFELNGSIRLEIPVPVINPHFLRPMLAEPEFTIEAVDAALESGAPFPYLKADLEEAKDACEAVLQNLCDLVPELRPHAFLPFDDWIECL